MCCMVAVLHYELTIYNNLQLFSLFYKCAGTGLKDCRLVLRVPTLFCVQPSVKRESAVQPSCSVVLVEPFYGLVKPAVARF